MTSLPLIVEKCADGYTRSRAASMEKAALDREDVPCP